MENHEKIEFFKSRSVSDIVSVTFSFVKQGFKPLISSLLLIVIPMTILSTILIGSNDLFKGGQMEPNAIAGNFVILLANYFVMFTGLFLIMLVTNSYMLLYYSKENFKEITLSEIWDVVISKILHSFLGGILYFIALALGFVLILIPGIWLSISFSLLFPVIFFEDKNGADALGRSFNLVKNNWWATLGVLLLITIIFYAISLVFLLPSYIVAFTVGFNQLGDGNFNMQPIMMIMTFIGSLSYILYPVFYISTAFQYFNLVERKEAKGLMDKVNSIGNQVQ